MRYVIIDGKRYEMREIHRLYKKQKDARRPRQLTLFELREDARPSSQRDAAGRYSSPTLFDPA
jgi:hypothetical protein